MKIKNYLYLLKNSSWMLAEKLVSILSGLIVGLMVIKYLGPTEYGKLAYILSITGVLSFMIHLGMNNIVIKYFKQIEYSNHEIFGTSLMIRGVFAFCFFIIVNSFVFFYKSDLLLISLLISSSVFLDIFYVVYSYFISIEEPKQNTKAYIVSVLASSFFKLLLIYFNLDVNYFALVYLIENIIKYAILRKLFMKYDIEKFKFNKKLAKVLLKESFPVLIAGIVVGLYMNVDILMIEYFYDLKDVSIYATAVKLVMVWMMVPSILSLVIYPKLIESKDNNTNFNLKISLFYTIMFYVSLFIGFFMYFSSEYIINVLFNDEFVRSIAIIKIYIWVIVFYFIGQATEKYFILNNKTKYMSYNAIIGLFINIILNYMWIPEYGLEGAAYASVIATGYSAFFGLILFKETRYVLLEILKSIILTNIIKKGKNARN